LEADKKQQAEEGEAKEKERKKKAKTAKRKRGQCKGAEIGRGEGLGGEERCVHDRCLLCDVCNI
jgi:hypothetical protein